MSTILDSLQKSSATRDDSKKSIDNFNFADKKTSSKKNSLLIIVFFTFIIVAYLAYDYWQNLPSNTSDTNETIAEQTKPKAKIADNSDKNKAKSANNKKINKPNNAEVKEKMLALQEAKQTQLVKQKHQQNPEKNIEEGIKVKQNYDAKKPQTGRPKLTLEQDKKRSLMERINNPAQHIPSAKTQDAKKTRTRRSSTKKNPAIIKLEKPQSKIAHNNKPKVPVKQQKYHYIYQLPFSIRKDLPKFKLNVHIYDKDPKNRLIVINGEKFVIDDMIDEKALVKDIIPEGVVLDVDGTEFLIPKL